MNTRLDVSRKVAAFLALLSAIAASHPAGAAPGDITTKAGTAPLASRSVSLNFPAGISHDAAGNLYIADAANQQVRKVDLSGRVTRIAGSGIAGFAGDGGPAREANLSWPTDVTADAAGNVYIADRMNARVRKIDLLGKISTFAGNGTPGFSGDGGPATAAQLYAPTGVSVDAAGNVYIADRSNSRIRKVDTGGNISTFAGTGECGYFGDGGAPNQAKLCLPEDVFVEPSGNILIADTYNSVIRKIDGTGSITTVAGNTLPYYFGDGLPATLAAINWPRQVTGDSTGNIFIADSGNHRVRKVDAGGSISTLAGNDLLGTGGFSGDGGPATSASLKNPTGVAVDWRGVVAIADTDNHRIRKVNTAGIIGTSIGAGVAFGCDFTGDGGPALSASLCMPAGVAIDAAGNTYIVDRISSRVRKLSPAGTLTTTSGKGTAGYNGDGIQATSALLNLPEDVAVDAAGNIYIADTGNNRVRRIAPGGVISTFAGGGTSTSDGVAATTALINRPRGVAIGPGGEVYVSEGGSCRVRQISGGTITTVAGSATSPVCGYAGDGGAATGARLDSPGDLSVGPSGEIFVVDQLNHRIRRVAGGTISTVAGSGTSGFSGDGGPAVSAALSHPRGVFADGAGNVWIADTDNNRIRKVDPSGSITSVAGAGTPGDAKPRFGGDGGPATSAFLAYPSGIVFDASGNLLITDTMNDRLRSVQGPL